MMKTYTALVSAKVGNTTRMVKTEVKATSSAEAKWLLQAIYGFHAVTSLPTEKKEILTSEDLAKPASPEQQKINNLKAAKDRASDALKAERDRQKKTQALQTLRSISGS
jgi:hypothetical protein